MRSLWRLALISALAALLIVPAAAAPDAAAESKEEEEKEDKLAGYLTTIKIGKIELDPDQVVPVVNERFTIEYLDVTLEEGNLYFAKPYEDGDPPYAAWFEGKGRMSFVPPTEVGRFMLEDKIGKETVSSAFSEALFAVFPGGVFENLLEQRGRASGDRGKQAEQRFKKRLESIGSIPFASASILGVPPRPEWGDVTAVNMNTSEHGWVWYVRDPSSPRENIIWKELTLGFGQTYFDFADAENLWGNFDDKADLERVARGEMDPGHEQKDRLQMEHVEMDLTISKGSLLVKEDVKVTFTPLYDDESFTYFQLIWDPEGDHSRTKVLSVKENGKDLPFEHRAQILLVGLDEPTKAGEKRTLEIQAEFDIVRAITYLGPVPPGVELPPSIDWLDQEAQTFSLLNTFPWFPQHGFLQRYTIDWTIRVPKPNIAVASGTTMKRWEEDGYNCLHSVEKERIALASVLLGRYETYTDDSKRPTIHIHALRKQNKSLKGMAETSRNIIDLYEERLGPFPYDELDLGQMGFFFGFGQAPPGLVQLTGEAFLSDGEIADFGGTPTFKWAFIAHEIGHEWFGHVVSWASTEDQWLSESFTEYMSGLYVKALAGFGENAFETKKRQWKERAELSKDKGPIEAGVMNGGFHYQNQTYFKGPYVLHMFHEALMAEFGPEQGNDLFFETLREFMDKHRHQNASTRDLQVVVKEVTGLNMDWFFDQWYRGVGVPEVTWDYDVRQTEDGKYLIEGEVRQIDASGQPKALLVPIYLHYGKDVSEPIYRVTTDQQFEPMAVYPVKLKVANRPDKVTIDDNGTLLGNVSVQ